jgi:hypothetical protein
MSQRKAREKRVLVPGETAELPMLSPQELIANVIQLRGELNSVHTWLQLMGSWLEEMHPGFLEEMTKRVQEFNAELEKAQEAHEKEQKGPLIWQPKNPN